MTRRLVATILLEETERWAPIPSCPGYEASDLGRVRSWLRQTGTCRPPVEPRVMRQTNNRGYRRVALFVNGRRTDRSVHDIVLEAFVGPRPAGMVCRHFPDRTKSNNRLSNLQWGTLKENSDDKVVHGTVPCGDRHSSRLHPELLARGEASGMAKLTEPVVSLMRYLHAEHGVACTTMSRWFDASQPTVTSAVRGDTWAHVPPHTIEGSSYQVPAPKPHRSLTAAKVVLIRYLRTVHGVYWHSLAEWFEVSRGGIEKAASGATWPGIPLQVTT